MKILKIISAILILALTLNLVSAYSSYDYNTPNSVTFTEKWNYHENLRGKNRFFTLTHTVTTPSNVYEEKIDTITPSIYGTPTTRFSSYRYTPYARDQFSQPYQSRGQYSSSPNSYSGTSNPGLSEAFRTFQRNSYRTRYNQYGSYSPPYYSTNYYSPYNNTGNYGSFRY
jgi:hypothetical protein